MVHLDTSALVAAFVVVDVEHRRLRQMVADGDAPAITTLVLYEWWRGPRTAAELSFQEQMFPAASAVPFGGEEADIAASIYRRVRRARHREFDIAIAACAISHGAALWTLNPRDFADIPGLELV